MTGRTGLFVARDDDDNGTTPLGARMALSGLLEWAGPNPLDVATGVLFDDGSPVVVGKANMSYDVRAFVAVGRLSAAIGPWIAANDATVNVLTTPAPGANSRYDVIWCRQHMVAADGGADADVDLEIGVTQGVAAGSPTVPSVPSGAVALYRVLVPTGTTATNVLTFTRLHEWIGTRSGGAWRDYTPTKTNWAGTFSQARYSQSGKTVTVHLEATVTTVTSTFQISLPVTAAYVQQMVGTIRAADTSIGQSFPGTVQLLDASTIFFYPASGSINAWTNTVPFTWASGDVIQASFTYEAA